MSSLLDIPAHLALVLSLAATTVGSEPAGPSLFTGRSTPTPVASLNLKTVEGPFRFGEGAWLRALKDSLPPNEAPPFALGIFQTSGGRYYVPSTSDRPLIFNERHNLALAARVAQAYAQSNARALRTSLQRAPSAGELYIAHIFGHEAASDFVRAVESSPQAIAAVRLADLARAAPEVFLQKTCAQVYQQITAAVHARIPRSGPRVRVLSVKREPKAPPVAKPALFSMGQSMATAREANSSVAWQAEVNTPHQ